GMCARRVTLDEVLVDAARGAGAEVRTGVRMTGLLRDDSGRVVGIETNEGPIGAEVVIGADGRRSTIADLVGAREYGVAPPGRMFMWGYFTGVSNREPHVRLARLGDLAYLSSPCDGDEFLVAVVPSMSRKHEFMADRERSLRDGIRAWPELHDIVGEAELAGPIRAVTSWHGFFRESAGPGWALLGDAGQFKDPTAGQGISDSLRHSAHLADAVVGGLRGGPAAMDAQLRRWWLWRDRDCREIHWLSADLGAPGPVPPVREAVFADIAADADASLAFMKVLNHDGRPSKVFSAGRMVRAAARLVRQHPDMRREIMREVGELIGDNVRHTRLDRPRNRATAFRRSRRPVARRESASETVATSASHS
ncbi:MAG TPA: FAD-dependent monooxygenase, partial [Jatrophihabitantaceae bacterium]|nr:FAD-dependent monooxygenase [Jatrophihabitantaceae bacterium]